MSAINTQARRIPCSTNQDMKNKEIYYSVGPLLYCPANRESIAGNIINERFGRGYSLALCLEDTIRDTDVTQAENSLCASLKRIYEESASCSFYLPKIFVRVRNPEQMKSLYEALGDSRGILTGFILPKFSPENADAYLEHLVKINEDSSGTVYTMPILESPFLTDLRRRADFLYELKDRLKDVEDLVLNIRVGGNDLCHIFGFRRHSDQSIHRIRPIADIFSDIITVFGPDYVVSGPVWEYYSGHGWKDGLINELADDMLCGFTGKTVIHPNQIAPVTEAYRVTTTDLEDAARILDTDPLDGDMVSSNAMGERMNEYKTHTNWARKTLLLARTYGVSQA